MFHLSPGLGAGPMFHLSDARLACALGASGSLRLVMSNPR
jgi:hypothetical protein